MHSASPSGDASGACQSPAADQLTQTAEIVRIYAVRRKKVAERVGFEPTDARASPVFKTGALNQLDHLSLWQRPPGAPQRENYDIINRYPLSIKVHESQSKITRAMRTAAMASLP